MKNRILIDAKSEIPGFEWQSGKVRDWVEVGLGQRLIISTDRISAFDVVLPNGIAGKGWVLNQLSIFWRNFFKGEFPGLANDLVSSSDESCFAYLGVLPFEQKELLEGRLMLVRNAEVIPVECVVRGYITGSGWKDYQEDGTVCGIKLPSGLRESEKLRKPIFTPTTKAPSGEHDAPLNFSEMQRHIEEWVDANPGVSKIVVSSRLLAGNMRSTSLRLYEIAEDYARERGIIIADTKFEFGIIAGELCLIDEVLTPDSSRFWPMVDYKPGGPQPSFDKQPVRDWLDDSGWNKKPPAPELPPEVVQATTERYKEAYQRLTAKSLD